MIRAVSCRLAKYFLEHKWIEKDNYEWCLYVVEKKLIQFCFLLVILGCSIISGQAVNVLIFMLTMYFLRSRIGGWHASSNSLCLTLTIVSTLAVLFMLGPILLDMNFYILWLVDLLLMAVACLTKPVYPPQLHFEEAVVKANIAKKNLILLCILLVQICCFLLGMRQVLVFSFYGVLMSILLVFIERVKQTVYGG